MGFCAGHDKVVVRLLRGFAYRACFRGVVADANGFAPLVGAVDIGPVDRIITEEDNITWLCRNLDRVYCVRMVSLRR